jgi:hypothetical protein
MHSLKAKKDGSDILSIFSHSAMGYYEHGEFIIEKSL